MPFLTLSFRPNGNGGTPPTMCQFSENGHFSSSKLHQIEGKYVQTKCLTHKTWGIVPVLKKRYSKHTTHHHPLS